MKFSLIKHFGVVVLFTSLFSCQQNSEDYVDEGTITGKTYKNKELGWTMKVPYGWNLETKKSAQSNVNKGTELIEESGVDVDISELKLLLNFKKDEFNDFQSTSEIMKGWTLEEWKENNILVKRVLFETFEHQGIDFDTSSYTIIVDDLEFDVFHTRIYAPNGKVILEQDICSRLINGYDFGATMSYNNKKDWKVLWEAFLSSRFTKRSQAVKL